VLFALSSVGLLIAKSNIGMKKYLYLLAGLVTGLQLQAIVFTPTPADLGDLDHHYAYSWGINWDLAFGPEDRFRGN